MSLCARLFFSVALTGGALTGFVYERVEERAFTTGGEPMLKINAYRGLISVESTDDPVVRINVAASTGLEDVQAGEQVLRHLQLEWGQAGDVITLTAVNPHETAVSLSWHEDEKLDLVIKVTVPRSCHLEVLTGSGSIRLGEVAGDVRLKTGRGTIFCRLVEGTVTAENDRGDIVVSRCQGDVNLATKHGGIRTGTIGGRAVLSAVTGDIEIYSARLGLMVRTDGGNVVAGIPKQFSGEALVETNGGSVTLKIDPAAMVAIDATSIWGKIRLSPLAHSNLPLVTESGGLGQRRLTGKLNGGGSVIQVRASGGHVYLAGEAPPFG